MLNKLVLTCLVMFTLLTLTCNNNPVTPPDDTKPGSRDYVWTADTLWTEDFFGITDMWGSSPNSIWMVASGTSAKDCLWYYNGEKWIRYNQLLSPGLNTVFGANANEIWIGDSFNTIWRNKGSGWEKFQQFTLEGFDNVVITSIYGTSANNLYASGFADDNNNSNYKGIILKYNGTNWKFLDIPDIKVSFNRIKRINDGKYLIWATNFENGIFLEKLFIFDGNGGLKEIYSDNSYPHLNEMNEEVYVTINNRIYKWNNEKLELWKEFPSNIYYGNVLGRNEKDFFGCGYEGILHYNGTDLVNLYPTQLDLHGALIFDQNVFFDGYSRSGSGYNYIIIRGILKDE